jgi:hypothetical protein
MRHAPARRTGCFLTIAIAVAACGNAMALPVFPGAVGFGTDSIAGRGGRILRVTNLDDDGPGSLRAAMTASGPRVAIFEVSGIIALKTTLYAGNPYLTVAGQTAPSPGIMVTGAPIVLYGHDMLVQHIASRPGSAFPPGEVINNRDAFGVSSDPGEECYNIVFDHVSGSWSTDEILSTWADDTGVVRNVTVSNSVFAEALTNAGHTDEATGAPEAHSAGVLIGRNSRRVSLLRNVMAYNRWRNPLCRDDYTDVQVVNNLVYLSDPYDRIGISSDGRANLPVTASVCGNVYFADRDAESIRRPYAILTHTLPEHVLDLYVRDNWLYNPNTGNGPPYWAPTNGDPWQVVAPGDNRGTVNRLQTEPPQFAALKVPLLGSWANVEEHLLANAGARPADRDPVDARIVRQIRARTGSYIDHPDEVGGYPSWKPVSRPLVSPENPNGDDDRDGYTNLEEWLHRYSAAVEKGL